MSACGLLRPAIVAIPAKNEAERLPACLEALQNQVDGRRRRLRAGIFRVLVLANGCTDDTARLARSLAARGNVEIRVVEATLSPVERHAGGARGRAMDLAADWLDEIAAPHGVVLTTDADSRVAPDWIAANLARFAQGADAVLGRLALDEEGEWLPPLLHARGKLEAVYEDLLTEFAYLLDPQEANPWPHHGTISGATLALTRRAYLAVGGLPRVALGEDKALVAALRRRDFRICFAPEVRVVTSGRIAGRAPGGVADALKLRSLDPHAPCDEALEPCAIAFRRALWRGRFRRAGVSGRGLARLRVDARAAQAVETAETFGLAWERVEQASPLLERRTLSPQALPGQIEIANRLLRRLQARIAAKEDDQAKRDARDSDPVAS